MERIDNWDEYFMRMAYLVSFKSRDPKTKIGSVLVREKNVIATGYNSFPRKVLDLQERYANRDLKLKMTNHSEENTILTSARLGINTSNSILYTFGIPCHVCSKAIIQGSISEIVIHAQWPNLTHSDAWIESIKLGKTMLNEAAINIRVFDKKLNLKGWMDGKEIDV